MEQQLQLRKQQPPSFYFFLRDIIKTFTKENMYNIHKIK